MAADYGTYSLADVAAQVMEKDAARWSRTGAPLALEDEVVRYWKVDNHLHERVLVFLDLYGDGDHCDASSSGDSTVTECHAISDPAVGQGVRLPGLWRVVRNWTDPQANGMVFQLLRRGWLTSLVSGGVAVWSEARLIDHVGGEAVSAGVTLDSSDSSPAEDWRHLMLRVAWTGVAPTAAETAAAGLRGLGAANWTPVIRGES